MNQELRRIQSLLVTIGDSSNSPVEKNLEILAKAAIPLFQNHSEFLTDLLFLCICSLPTRTPLYGTFVGLLNKDSEVYSCVEDIVKQTIVRLKNAILVGKLTDQKLLLRFLLEMVHSHVISAQNFFDFLKEDICGMFIVCGNDDEETQNEWKRDWFAYLVTNVLMWVSEELEETCIQEIREIVNVLENYFNQRIAFQNLRKTEVNFFQVMIQDKKKDLVELQWNVLERVSLQKETISECIFRPYVELYSVLQTSQLHNIPRTIAQQIQKEDENIVYPVFYPSFNIYEERIADCNLMTQLVVEDYISDLLILLEGSVKEAVTFLLNLPTTYSYHRCIVNVIFRQMFMLPYPPTSGRKIVYYFSVIRDLCKIQRAFIPELVGAVNYLFSRIHLLDFECVDKFSEWFSFHLSHFKYLWNWPKWLQIIDDNNYSDNSNNNNNNNIDIDTENCKLIANSQKLFLCDVFERCLRFTYLENFEKSLMRIGGNVGGHENFMEKIKVYFPKNLDPIYTDLAEVNSSFHPLVKILSKMLATREEASVVANFLRNKTFADNISKSDVVLDSKEILYRFIRLCLYLGRKSIAHMTMLFQRYAVIFSDFFSQVSEQRLIMECVGEVWLNAPYQIIVLTEIMLTHKIITHHKAILEWIFSYKMAEFHDKSFLWDCLRNVLQHYQYIQNTTGTPVLFDFILSLVNSLLDSFKDTYRYHNNEQSFQLKRIKSFLREIICRYPSCILENRKKIMDSSVPFMEKFLDEKSLTDLILWNKLLPKNVFDDYQQKL